MAVVKRYTHSNRNPHHAPKQRADLAAPAVVRDYMEPMQSMADGREYDSRSSYYKSLKEQGMEIVGNDSGIENPGPKPYKPEGVGQSIKDAMDQLDAGHKPD